MNRELPKKVNGPPLIGVLALQGAFREHTVAIQTCGATAREIRLPQHLEGVDALVIPGGESTTIGKLMVTYGLLEPIRRLGRAGLPILGTCAGMVMLAKGVAEGDQPLLGLMDITARRNAFGRQVHSFELPVQIPAAGLEPFPGVFIRAPWIEHATESVDVLATRDGKGVAARQGNLLVTAFHPELTPDMRIHALFLDIVSERA